MPLAVILRWDDRLVLIPFKDDDEEEEGGGHEVKADWFVLGAETESRRIFPSITRKIHESQRYDG